VTGSETGRPEEMITDEMVDRAQRAFLGQIKNPMSTRPMRAALTAVAEELAERGAAKEKERERIAAAIDADAADIVNGITEDEYVHGIYDGLHRGANIARRSS
jgi:hypothetical protein